MQWTIERERGGGRERDREKGHLPIRASRLVDTIIGSMSMSCRVAATRPNCVIAVRRLVGARVPWPSMRRVRHCNSTTVSRVRSFNVSVPHGALTSDVPFSRSTGGRDAERGRVRNNIIVDGNHSRYRLRTVVFSHGPTVHRRRRGVRLVVTKTLFTTTVAGHRITGCAVQRNVIRAAPLSDSDISIVAAAGK